MADGRGSNPNSRANLTPWQKGESGNPEGLKPGTVQLKTLMRQFLNEKVEGKDVTYQEMLIRRMIHGAIVRDRFQAQQLIWETFEGKATQKHEVNATVVQKANPEIKRLTDQLNAVYRGTSSGGNGGTTSIVGSETPNKD